MQLTKRSPVGKTPRRVRKREHREAAMSRILIIEDQNDIRESLAELLEEEGYTVATAANGRQALDGLARGLEPSVILLDLMMPGMDGWEFRRRQQRDPDLAGIPVVIMSAVDQGSRLAGLDAAAYVRKPLDLRRLLAAVEDCCGQRAGCGGSTGESQRRSPCCELALCLD